MHNTYTLLLERVYNINIDHDGFKQAVMELDSLKQKLFKIKLSTRENVISEQQYKQFLKNFDQIDDLIASSLTATKRNYDRKSKAYILYIIFEMFQLDIHLKFKTFFDIINKEFPSYMTNLEYSSEEGFNEINIVIEDESETNTIDYTTYGRELLFLIQNLNTIDAKFSSIEAMTLNEKNVLKIWEKFESILLFLDGAIQRLNTLKRYQNNCIGYIGEIICQVLTNMTHIPNPAQQTHKNFEILMAKINSWLNYCGLCSQHGITVGIDHSDAEYDEHGEEIASPTETPNSFVLC